MTLAWHPQIHSLFQIGQYESVAQFYEQQIENEPETLSHYWFLGLIYLLQGKEEEAQATWFFPLTQEVNTDELVELLDQTAIQQEELGNVQSSWLLRGYIQELQPDFVNNLLHLIEMEILLGQFSSRKLKDWNIRKLLTENLMNVDLNLLKQVLPKVLEFPSFASVDFARASLTYFSNAEIFIELIKTVAQKMAYERFEGAYAADLIQVCLQIQPDNLTFFNQQVSFNKIGKRYEQALEAGQQFYAKATTPDLKLLGNYHILSTLLHGGRWLEVDAIAQRHKHLLKEFITSPPKSINPLVSNGLQGLTFSLSYLQDNPLENRKFQNYCSQLFQAEISQKKTSYNTPKLDVSRPLKIGYIGHTFRRHSVGWLSRWLLHYHNRDNFNIFIYAMNQPKDDLTQNWFCRESDRFYIFQRNPQEVMNQIKADQIDILVDLDSITHNMTCQIMAHKLAPIQVTWLGMDASGLPNIDYFIADPYVLPENAQNYYSEKIWRLTKSYLAIDGFEVGTPTLRREDLNIPNNAIIYLTVQTGLKRHPDTIRLQLEIIKAIPNSYLLIKGNSDLNVIQHLFNQLAQEIGVESSKLRFLSQDENEETHRANLRIADIVLDTYPYNGATTTLEVLWMGIPLVTKVGEQFAARNSYTFLKNTGIAQGIAWSDEEYIQWGIRLGQDEQLRTEIAWKLKKSRQTSPLWNAKQFTQEMEQAYQQMWDIYVSQ
jgi:predicted O-linked N-acetylglucosamine transferase (SPINDLY family)